LKKTWKGTHTLSLRQDRVQLSSMQKITKNIYVLQ
jgi:hypothetical protein